MAKSYRFIITTDDGVISNTVCRVPQFIGLRPTGGLPRAVKDMAEVLALGKRITKFKSHYSKYYGYERGTIVVRKL